MDISIMFFLCIQPKYHNYIYFITLCFYFYYI